MDPVKFKFFCLSKYNRKLIEVGRRYFKYMAHIWSLKKTNFGQLEKYYSVENWTKTLTRVLQKRIFKGTTNTWKGAHQGEAK